MGIAYNEGLPTEFKSKFPTLREAYGDLSAAIHAANPSDDVFKKAKAQIEKHFDARRLFELAD